MRRGPASAFQLESLESRINLSSVSAVATPPATEAGLAPLRRYRHEAAAIVAQAGSTSDNYGKYYVNPAFVHAQKFLQHGRNGIVQPAPSPIPGPAPTPAPAPINGTPVVIAQQDRGDLTRLVLTGTGGDDTIIVSKSGTTLTIQGNGIVNNVTGNFGEIAIYGGNGNDTITVQSSVDITALLYGGAGNNTLTAGGLAQSYVVTIGSNSLDALTGNGINTAFWADPTDAIRASAAETAGGDVHRVGSFYQPFTTNPAAANYVGTTLNGPNLPDPTDSGTTINLANRSLFGVAPAIEDVNQGQVGDCYFLSSIDSFAANLPARLQQMAVDLGDGTYAIQFKRNGVTSFVRVDADLPAGPSGALINNSPKGNGPIWATIMEKAYAFFRKGANTWASLGWGWTGSVYSDFGVANTTFYTSGSGTTLYTTITNALAVSKAVSIISVPNIVGAPIIASHSYSILSTWRDSSGTMWFKLRNTWGIDGAGSDANPYDGIVVLTLAQLQTNFSAGSISN